MKRQLQNRSERGIALVITLVMLAIVTVMAIVFLGVSRRERASVKVAEDIATANAMADSALERAKAEAIARMSAEGSKLYYDLFNSRSFVNPNGFKPQAPGSEPDPQNVSYVDSKGNPLSEQNSRRMLANLQYDPRVPVFVETNANGAKEFRFYLDFDRNRSCQTNGIVPVVNDAGRQIEIGGKPQFADLNGDPEWIGVLERPDYPHSETNRFIGRLAYLALPAGKTLDLNFVHNQGNLTAPDFLAAANAPNGFTRNQGVGSWEINLAAFFRELNTNAWPRGTYNYRPGNRPTGAAFDDARAFLAFRYPNRKYLKTVSLALNENAENTGLNLFDRDEIDNFGDGPFILPNDEIFRVRTALPERENDNPALPWPGSSTTNAFTDLQQLFSINSQDFSNRFEVPLRRRNTADQYQFYRMAAQLGVDSTPAIKGKLHLNFDNAVGKITNTVIAWNHPTNSALRFFTNAADLMLRASIDAVVRITNGNQALQWGRQLGTYYKIGDTLVSTNFSITNIQVFAPFNTNFPSIRQNEYSPAVHRILQVAANIYDNMTNKPYAGVNDAPYLPTVFRPIFTKTATNLHISGWTEVTRFDQVASGWTMDLADAFWTNRIPRNLPLTNVNFFGEHLVVAAKKGHPSFNELALQTTTEIARKLEVEKGSAGGPPTATNQMFLFSLEQRWGMEAWNSYLKTYSRPVSLVGQVQSTVSIKDGTNLLARPLQLWRLPAANAMTLNTWKGFTNLQSTNFVVVLNTNFVLLQDIAYTRTNGFRQTNVARFSPLEQAPKFVIQTTNNVRFFIVDRTTQRIIDFVSFDNLTTSMDLSKELAPTQTSSGSLFGGGKPGDNEDIYWDPTPISGLPNLTKGITNQLAAAAGEIEVSDAVWKAFRHSTAIQKDNDKEGAIAVWRKFLGLPLLANSKPVGPLTDLRRQIPFVPSRRVEQNVSWQVNDPFVHYMAQDIAPIPGTDTPRKKPILEPPGPSPWNIGVLNVPGYRPWGGSPLQQSGGKTGDKTSFSVGVKDAGIRRSDDWDFPVDEVPRKNFHYFANIGELGRIHRGTPWQTLYLKSIYTIQNTSTGLVTVPLPGTLPTDWKNWAGSAGTHPMHDWKLLDVFTTAPNENATRGLLSVNQTNRAAWSAVLSGIVVPTNIVENSAARSFGDHEGADPVKSYHALLVEPATPPVATIVDSINYARRHQLAIVPNPNLGANPKEPWIYVVQRNPVTGRTNNVFERLGDILSAPHLSVQSPFLNTSGNQPKSVITDRALEYIPQQILSLLQRDEPRFVVYAFGQSLKPAPRSLTSDPNFYHMCTNYQITGEVMSKTIFRVEGQIPIPNDPLTQNQPLRAVVESYEVLPPVE